MKDPIWHTADGRAIPLSEMTDSHIANARNYLERYNDDIPFWHRGKNRADNWIELFQKEQDRRDREKKDQLNRIERKVDAISEALGIEEEAPKSSMNIGHTLNEALEGLGRVETIEEDMYGTRVTFYVPRYVAKPKVMMFDIETSSFPGNIFDKSWFQSNIDATGRTVKGKKTAATIKSRRKATTTKVTKDAKRGRSEGRSVRGKTSSTRKTARVTKRRNSRS